MGANISSVLWPATGNRSNAATAATADGGNTADLESGLRLNNRRIPEPPQSFLDEARSLYFGPHFVLRGPDTPTSDALQMELLDAFHTHSGDASHLPLHLRQALAQRNRGISSYSAKCLRSLVNLQRNSLKLIKIPVLATPSTLVDALNPDSAVSSKGVGLEAASIIKITEKVQSSKPGPADSELVSIPVLSLPVSAPPVPGSEQQVAEASPGSPHSALIQLAGDSITPKHPVDAIPPFRYKFSLGFDCTTPCSITIYFQVKECLIKTIGPGKLPSAVGYAGSMAPSSLQGAGVALNPKDLPVRASSRGSFLQSTRVEYLPYRHGGGEDGGDGSSSDKEYQWKHSFGPFEKGLNQVLTTGEILEGSWFRGREEELTRCVIDLTKDSNGNAENGAPGESGRRGNGTAATVWPVVIVLAALASVDSVLDKGGMLDVEDTIPVQTTYCTLTMGKDGGYDIKPVKQRAQNPRAGATYLLQEIYGLSRDVEPGGGAESAAVVAAGVGGSNDDGKECVICLSAPRFVLLLPCRHLCLCSPCAEAFRWQGTRNQAGYSGQGPRPERAKCPICRGLVDGCVKIGIVPAVAVPSVSSAGGDADKDYINGKGVAIAKSENYAQQLAQDPQQLPHREILRTMDITDLEMADLAAPK